MARQYPDDSTTLHTDAYELSMIQTYFEKGIQNKRAIFEVFFFAICHLKMDSPFLRVFNTSYIISKTSTFPKQIFRI